jgi:AcrR family transcriptional regulator
VVLTAAGVHACGGKRHECAVSIVTQASQAVRGDLIVSIIGGMGMSAYTRSGAAAQPTSNVRERILQTARDLFYREGARAVGVDTVVSRSAVAKTSLYRWFPSKDALIIAVLEAESRDRWAQWDSVDAQSDAQPLARLRAHLEQIAALTAESEFRGCPFMNLTAEFPDPQHPVRRITRGEEQQLRRRVQAIVEQIDGVSDPVMLTEQLMVLIFGALSLSQSSGDPIEARQLVAAGDTLVAGARG